MDGKDQDLCLQSTGNPGGVGSLDVGMMHDWKGGRHLVFQRFFYVVEFQRVAIRRNRGERIAHLDFVAHVETHAIERYGVGTLREIFRGYTALPAAVSPDDWRKVLNDPPTLAHAETYYRQAMKAMHPDLGGSEAQEAALNAAIAAARKAFAS